MDSPLLSWKNFENCVFFQLKIKHKNKKQIKLKKKNIFFYMKNIFYFSYFYLSRFILYSINKYRFTVDFCMLKYWTCSFCEFVFWCKTKGIIEMTRRTIKKAKSKVVTVKDRHRK